MWYLRVTLPVLSRTSIIGCFFSSGLSTAIFRESPVTSSTSSWNGSMISPLSTIARASLVHDDVLRDVDGFAIRPRMLSGNEAAAYNPLLSTHAVPGWHSSRSV